MQNTTMETMTRKRLGIATIVPTLAALLVTCGCATATQQPSIDQRSIDQKADDASKASLATLNSTASISSATDNQAASNSGAKIPDVAALETSASPAEHAPTSETETQSSPNEQARKPAAKPMRTTARSGDKRFCPQMREMLADAGIRASAAPSGNLAEDAATCVLGGALLILMLPLGMLFY
jgi:hypothetical protein